ncbi:hypothetical protein [Terribacillus saccharophilus]|uniref:hypothetical protein n=1 Tax=Terribacillus saccharophilus TaxID=361277 RepID=UPI000BA59FAE|nr:hypothetical protein [Terribacillus saccharophilus]PAF15733.1 hypothetical protein CHH51_18380 [Terribacillus saccharophilus]
MPRSKYRSKKVKHEASNSKLYQRWADMLQRCNNENSNNYKYYGAKGICVCNDWRDFSAFKDWADRNGYQEGLSIDRINPEGNYEPEK